MYFVRTLMSIGISLLSPKAHIYLSILELGEFVEVYLYVYFTHPQTHPFAIHIQNRNAKVRAKENEMEKIKWQRSSLQSTFIF